MVGAIIVVIAGVLIVRAVMKDDSGQTQRPDAEFALPQTSTAQQTTSDPAAQAPEDKTSEVETVAPPEADANKPKDKPVICGELIRSLGDLNSKAMDKDRVFVFLAGQDDAMKSDKLKENK